MAFLETEAGAQIPNGDTVINAGDTLGVASRTSDLASIAQFAQTTILVLATAIPLPRQSDAPTVPHAAQHPE